MKSQRALCLRLLCIAAVGVAARGSTFTYDLTIPAISNPNTGGALYASWGVTFELPFLFTPTSPSENLLTCCDTVFTAPPASGYTVDPATVSTLSGQAEIDITWNSVSAGNFLDYSSFFQFPITLGTNTPRTSTLVDFSGPAGLVNYTPTLQVSEVVPEPASMALVLSGLGVLALRRRRRE